MAVIRPQTRCRYPGLCGEDAGKCQIAMVAEFSLSAAARASPLWALPGCVTAWPELGHDLTVTGFVGR